MKNLYIKTLAATALICSSVSLAAQETETETPSLNLIRENRTGWIIKGCSQCAVGEKKTDGGLQEMIDDNINSFWHSNWYGTGDDGPGHYFVIDRGANAPEIFAFGYLPRQNSTGNGFITEYRLFALDSSPELEYCDGSWSTAEGAHEAFATWAADKTPLIDDKFEITYDDINTHGEHVVNLAEPTSARYLVFAIDETSGRDSNKFANCAEFYTYVDGTGHLFDDLYVGKRVSLYTEGRQSYFGISAAEDGTLKPWSSEFGPSCVWTIAKTEGGKYTLYNELFKVYIPAVPDDFNKASVAVTDAASAGEWNASLRYFDGPVVFDYGLNDYDCIHMAGDGALVRWQPDEAPSQFIIAPITDDTYAEWIENATPAIGYKDATDKAALNEALEAAKADPSNLEKQQALADIEKNGAVILPDPAKFYTITHAQAKGTGPAITEPYTEDTTVKAEELGDNIVPSIWRFTSCAEPNADLYTISSVNTGNVLSYTRWGENMTIVAPTDEKAGEFDIMNELQRGHNGVSLINYLNADRTDRATARLQANGAIDSYNAGTQAWKIVEVSEIPVTITEGYGSFNFPFAVTIPEGVSVYTIGKTDESYAYLADFEGEMIPANTPVIVASEEETVNFPIITLEVDTPQTEAESLLKGTNVPAKIENAYTISGGIFTPADGEVPANCVYIVSEGESDLEIAIPVKGISLSDTEVTLNEGETQEIEVIFTPENATVKEVVWSSSNKAVATCSKGIIRAGVAGTAVLTATCGEFKATCKVTVVTPVTPVQNVTLSKTELSLEVGETEVLTATVTPEDATDKTVTWTTSNETVATVSADGTVTAVAAGTATITATCGDFKAECAVTVTEVEEEDLISEILANPGVFKIYDLAGRQVKNATKGVYIINLNGKARKVTL